MHYFSMFFDVFSSLCLTCDISLFAKVPEFRFKRERFSKFGRNDEFLGFFSLNIKF